MSGDHPRFLRSKDVLDASVAIRSKMSLTNEFRMAMALFEIPVSGWTCLRTIMGISECDDRAQLPAYPCRCNWSTSPCGPFASSSSRRLHPWMLRRSWWPSLQPCLWSLRVPWRRRWRQGPWKRWKQAWEACRVEVGCGSGRRGYVWLGRLSRADFIWPVACGVVCSDAFAFC